jgi:hypothetical protein
MSYPASLTATPHHAFNVPLPMLASKNATTGAMNVAATLRGGAMATALALTT